MALTLLLASQSVAGAPEPLPAETLPAETLRLEIVAEHPHDPRAFTQGLVWHEGSLYESTGLYGSSSLRRVDPETGDVHFARPVDGQFFAEGLARVRERLYQLTWQAGVAFVYDLGTFDVVDQLSYSGEGWGLAWDGEAFVMSDGSNELVWRGPADFSELRRVRVELAGRPLKQLNELEWAEGAVWANVLSQDRIVRIDPTSGRVTGVVDASGLLTPRERLRADVLNGIAWDPESESFWITGKLWPKIFQVRFVADGAER